MDYMTLKEAAEKWGVTPRSANYYCAGLDFREKPLRPSVTVTGLEIDYIPTTSVAVDSLYRQQLDLRIFADEFLRAAIQADSL